MAQQGDWPGQAPYSMASMPPQVCGPEEAPESDFTASMSHLDSESQQQEPLRSSANIAQQQDSPLQPPHPIPNTVYHGYWRLQTSSVMGDMTQQGDWWPEQGQIVTGNYMVVPQGYGLAQPDFDADAPEAKAMLAHQDSFQSGGAWPGQEYEDSAGAMTAAHPGSPRSNLPPWKWIVMQVMTAFCAFFYGYDIGNTANIQASVYAAFGRIELLPWIACAFSMASVAVTPIIRRLSNIFDLRLLLAASFVLVNIGAAVSGSAHNMPAFIVGRVINGIGSAGTYQISLSFIAVYASAAESPRCMSIVGASWALGLLSGPLIGGAFAENEHATWRWAMYINNPVVSALLIGCLVIYPSYTVPSPQPVLTQLAETDWLGALLHIASISLFSVAAISSGNIWPWNSPSAIVTWVVWGIVVIAYVVQQAFCIFTTPQQRIFPVDLLTNRPIGLAALCTCSIAMAYSVTLYYIPLFFAFAQGLAPIECAVHMMPFMAVFIFSALLSGALLPRVRRYKIFYVAAGALSILGGALMTTITSKTSTPHVLGYQAIVGFGLGLIWVQGVSLANAVTQEPATRFAAAALMNMSQLGPVSIGLATAAAVFQNYGYSRLHDAISPFGFDDLAVHEALAGAMSPIWTTANEAALSVATDTIVDVIARLFYMVLAGGIVCFLAACFMKWEALVFGKYPEKVEEYKV